MSSPLNPSRQRILARIQSALRDAKPQSVAVSNSAVFPSVENPLERFVAECKGNRTECLVCDGDVQQQLSAILAELPTGEIFVEDHPQIQELLSGETRQVRWSGTGPITESCVASVTRAEALIAQTGSLLMSSSCGGRGAYVVAPVHIVIGRESQLLPDLEAAMEYVSREQLAVRNSFVGVVTGCSRTGDIEKILVMGAHGPKRLVVLLQRG